MIFITVGTQLPFDRLIRHIDDWADRNPEASVFGQIGKGVYRPSHFSWKTDLSPSEFETHIDNCELIVSHAGIGSILNALHHKKKIIIFPRNALLREHRNDHQIATARWLKGRPGIYTALSSEELYSFLDNRNTIATPDQIPPHASETLINKISDFLNS